jgi:agmatinase
VIHSIIGYPDVASADAVVLGVPYDRDASFGAGAARGPEAILDCLDRQIELFERHSQTDTASRYQIASEVLDDVETMQADAMVSRVATRVAEIPGFVVMLGGTHAVSLGAFMAKARRLDPRSVTVVQIDAHLDMRNDDADYSELPPNRYAHSCVMRRAHELGFQTCSVGIRAYALAEIDYARQHGLPVFEWGRGPQPSIADILASVTTERVYLTIDVDGFDPSIFPATGTPVPGGLGWEFGTALLRQLCLARELIGADIVETAPDGRSGVTEYAAAQLCYDLISYKLLKQDGALRFN